MGSERNAAVDAVVSAAAGVSWGLALARLIAEAGFIVPLFGSVWAVGALALLCGVATLVGRRFSGLQETVPAYLFALFLPALYTSGLVQGPLAGLVLVAGSALVAVLSAFSDRCPWIVPAALILVTVATYLGTLLPSLGEADTFEFQVIVPGLGVAHPTGYPLYVLLTKVFTLLPIRSTAWRVNVASAVYATAAVLVLYYSILSLSRKRLPAFLAALAFAFSSVFWSQAIVAEVYALHALLVATLSWLLLADPSDGEGCRPARRWAWIALLLGLGLANHLTTILLAPAVIVALLWDRPCLKARHWFLAGILLLIGLSVYAFIPLRWPSLNDGRTMTIAQFAEHITGGQFRGALQLDGWRDPVRWSIVGRLIAEPIGWAGLALAAAGAVAAGARQRRTLALTGIAFVAFFGYGLVYHVPDISVFLIPAHLVLAIWMGLGVASIAEVGERVASSRLGRALVTVTALVPLGLVWLNLPSVDLSGTPHAEERGRRMLGQPLAPEGAILADPKRFAPLYYVQQIEGLRPDIDIVLLGTEEQYREALDARITAGQTVYLARFLPHLEHYHLRSAGPLVEVSAEPFDTTPTPRYPLSIVYESAIELAGIDFEGPAAEDDSVVRLALHWVAREGLQHDYFVRLRLLDGAGAVAYESEAVRPVAGMYPTSAWRPDEVIVDYHVLSVPPHVAPGTFVLEVGLFPPFSHDGLAVEDGGGPWAEVGEVAVAQTTSSRGLLSSSRVLFARSRWLTGHDSPREVVSGSPVELTLFWRMDAPDSGGSGSAPVLIWRDPTGQLHGQVAPAMPGGAGKAGSTVTRHALEAPPNPGEYGLLVAWVDGKGNSVPARCGWLSPAAALCKLADVHVLAPREGVANFDDQILLLEARAGAQGVNPGDSVPVALRWRALREIAEDYTEFIQLVGPDGRLHGQVDTWPVQGSLPTSQWRPGEDVVDLHEVRLDADAPAGLYAIHVGWYLLETMQRVQLADELGQPVGDAYTVAVFEVPGGPD